MNTQQILEELLGLLEVEGIKVRREPLGGGGGGFCAIKGERTFFVDTQSTATETAVLCAKAITKVADVENIYLRPEIRQFIENFSTNEKE
ncbi:MAG: hypothetical protein ACYSSI_04660 [Planctomycetota bacterium]|jgi:hypothetical protein